MQRKVILTLHTIGPMDHIVGTGPVDEDGLPTICGRDLDEAMAAADRGERFVYARAEVFPEAMTTSWISARTSDIDAAKTEALRNLVGKLAQLPWEN